MMKTEGMIFMTNFEGTICMANFDRNSLAVYRFKPLVRYFNEITLWQVPYGMFKRILRGLSSRLEIGMR